MVTFLLMLVLATILIIPLVIFIDIKITEKSKKKSEIRGPLIWFAFAMVFTIAFLITPEIAKNEMISEATYIADFEDATLYYDDAKDSYFYISTDTWNPAKLYYKRSISNDIAEAKIKDYKMLKEYENKAKVSFRIGEWTNVI